MNKGSKINYGLGIDTGGTYTDAAIVDLQTIEVLARSKSRTTHHDLSIGLGETVDRVLDGLGDKDFVPSLVGVSTTLATNSVLERKGGRVGLIGLGWRPEEGQEFGAKQQCFLSGGHDVRGRVQDTTGPGWCEKGHRREWQIAWIPSWCQGCSASSTTSTRSR